MHVLLNKTNKNLLASDFGLLIGDFKGKCVLQKVKYMQ